jgi:DNA polymerase III subunit gamma/tau
MSYQVLARKWRPRSFQDIVGQEHVLRVLINALSRKRLHHAYLFAGTRGVGKTTLARIFAKCLNCETDVTATPCDSCGACRAIDAGQFLDLYEIDAASRTKVEDTRELLENVAYPPVQGRYKVYLIDEVHMLSGHSFNALLKTLEEPPPQVIFIFATTEPKKLPITILSRCLQFHLKQIMPSQIAAQLQRICESEQVISEEKALVQLAEAADGSLRDALSLLDQAIVYCEEKLSQAEINQMLGYIAQDEIANLLIALTEHNGAQLLSTLARLQSRSPNYQQVLAELISILHQAAVVQVVPNPSCSDFIREIAHKLSSEDVQLYYQIALMGQKDLPFAPTPAQGFEMTLLRMLAFHPLTPTTETTSKPIKANKEPASQTSASSQSQSISQTSAAIPTTASTNWREILPQLGLTGLAQALASNCSIEKLSENRIEFILPANYKAMVTPKLIERIEQALSHYFNKAIKINLNLTSEVVSSPAKEQAVEHEVRRASALEALQQDASVQKIQSLFNAALDSDSLTLGSVEN